MNSIIERIISLFLRRIPLDSIVPQIETNNHLFFVFFLFWSKTQCLSLFFWLDLKEPKGQGLHFSGYKFAAQSGNLGNSLHSDNQNFFSLCLEFALRRFR